MKKELNCIIQECPVLPDTVQTHFKRLLAVPGVHLSALKEILVATHHKGPQVFSGAKLMDNVNA